MLKLIKFAFWAVIAICLMVVGLANKDTVTLNTVPEGLQGVPFAGLFTYSMQVPLFAVILAAVGVGLLIGFAWEWLREFKFRSEVGRKKREVTRLEREVDRLKSEKNEGKDEVLALLDDTRTAA